MIKYSTANTCAILVLVVLASVKLVAQNFSLANTPQITPLTNSRAQWADFNNDHLLDLFVTGTQVDGALQTRVYFSNGDNTFNILELPALTDVDFSFGDFNHDSLIDILIQGTDEAMQKHTHIFRNEGGYGFVQENFGLAPLSRGGVLWCDLDHDTDLDIVMTGLDEAFQEKTYVYEWRDGSYQLRVHTLPSLGNGRVKRIDLDRNGSAEILITGLDASGSARCLLYKVTNSLDFELLDVSLPGSAFNSISVSDLNNDGFDDFVLTGLSGNLLESTSQIFINNTNGGFVQVASGLVAVQSSSVSTGDLDNDGDRDILLTGHDDSGLNYTLYYRNDGLGEFSPTPVTLPVIYNGEATLVDYENDGDLDIFLTGASDISFQGNLFLSDASSFALNNAPQSPGNLTSGTNFSSVTLSWTPASDDHTSTEDLTYNVYISTDAAGQNLILAPLSSVNNGSLKVSYSGVTGTSTSFTFYNLPEGQYYWSVQSVDQSFRGSVFPPSQAFSICHSFSLGSDRTLCYGDTLDIQTGTAGDIVDWYSTSDGLLLAGSFTFREIISNNDTLVAVLNKPFGCSTSDTLLVMMEPLPDFTLGHDRDVCFGSQAVVAVNGGADLVHWFNPTSGQQIATGLHHAFHVVQRDTIVARAHSFPHGCVSYDTIIVAPLPLPGYDLGSDLQVCSGESAALEVADETLSVRWKLLEAGTLSPAQNSFMFSVKESETVVALLTDESGCSGSDTLRVQMLPVPAIDLGADRNICHNETTTIEVSPSANVLQWLNTQGESLSSDGSEYVHSAIQRDTIILRATDGNLCVNLDSIIVDVFPLPHVSIGADTAACFDAAMLLQTGTGYQRVDWYSKSLGIPLAENSWFFSYVVRQTDTLVARVVDENNCINYDSIQIKKLDLPDFSLGADTAVCDKERISMLIPGEWERVVWALTDGVTVSDNPSLTFLPQQKEAVIATVTGLNHCVRSDTINIGVLPLPRFDFGLSRSVCENDSVRLSVPDVAGEFAWHDGPVTIIGAKEYSFVASASKQVSLIVTDARGCRFKDSLSIDVNLLPRFSIIGDTAICHLDSASLSIPQVDFQQIEWSDGTGKLLAENSLSIDVLLQESGSVQAKLVDINGCVFGDTTFVRIRDLPVVDAGKDTLLCFGGNVRLGDERINPSGRKFSWQPIDFLDDPGAARPLATPQHSVTYSVLLEDEFGCSTVDSVFIDVNPQISVNAGDNASICIGQSVELGGTPTASGSRFPFLFEWSASNTAYQSTIANPIITPEVSTRYYVFVSSGQCEVFLDSVDITVNPLPVIESVPGFSIGSGGSVRLQAEGAQRYSWTPATGLDDPQSPSPIASPLLTTVYTVEGTDINGCKNTTNVVVLVQNSIFIPSLFTPNGDGINDTFRLFGSGALRLSLTIFTGAGVPVYHTDDPVEAFGAGWDGTLKGNPLPNDVYVWAIEGNYVNGDPVLYNGQSRGLLKLYR